MNRFGLGTVIAVGLASAAAGFVVRGLIRPSPPPAPPAAWEPLPIQPIPAPAPAPPVIAQVQVPPRPRVQAVVLPAAAPPPAAAPEVAAPAPPPVAVAPAPPAGKRIVVPYRALEGSAQRIIIPVTFNGRVTAQILLDTGAPSMHITYPLAARIGVLREGDSRLMTEARGIGGSAAAALVILDSISVGEASTEFVPVTVSTPISDAFEGLVGMDFVAGYSTQIDTEHHVLVLTELPPRGDAPGGHDEAWWRRTFGELNSQQALWQGLRARFKDRQDHSLASAGSQVDELRRLLDFSTTQEHEAQVLLDRLERYAASNAVPREWRR
jgi:hypothetical protein